MFTVEEVTGPAVTAAAASSAGFKHAGATTPLKKARTITQVNKTPIKRTPTGVNELDRVLGGGFVDAEVVLLSGKAGSGKSTLSLAIADKFAAKGITVLYTSGEESDQQIGLRAQRMGVTNELIHVTNETNLETVLGHIDDLKPGLVIVDSLQTLASSNLNGSMGSIQQSKEAAHTLTDLAKKTGITMVLISQLVKSGDFSGSEAIQHIVDATLMFESDSDTPLKFLRAMKNRFGDTTEVGVFQHAENGLEEVSDPSGVLIEEDATGLSGTSVSFVAEGVRQMPVEVQALVTSSNLPTPRKQFNGVDYGRGQIVCAILDKFCNAKLYENDVFVNTVSGIKVNDPNADLSIAASILSSLKAKPFTTRTAFVGELSLTGRVRGSFMMDQKVKEAKRLGFEKIVLPSSAKATVDPTKHRGIVIDFVSSIADLKRMLG